MLESNGNSILVAQNTISGFSTEIADLSGSGKPVKIAFSAELTRAQESISGQSADVKTKTITPTDLRNLVDNAVVGTAPEDTDGAGVAPQRILGSSTTPLQELSSSPVDVTELHTTLSGVQLVGTGSEPSSSVEATKSPTSLPVTIEFGSVGISQTVLANNSIGEEQLVHNGTASLNLSDDPGSLVGLSSVPAQQDVTSKISVAEAQLGQQGIELLNSEGAAITPVDVTADTALMANAAVNGEIPITAKAVDNVSAVVANTQNAGPNKITNAIDIAGTAVMIEKTAIAEKTATAETTEIGKAGVQGATSKAIGEQIDNAAQLYKPSPALVKSGLGRISVELNGDVNSVTQTIGPVVAGQSVVNSTISASEPVGSRQSTGAGFNPVAEANTDKVATIPGHEFLRLIGSVQTEPSEQKLSKPSHVAGTTASLDEAKPVVTLPTLSNTATASGLTNSPVQNTLAESAITGAGAKAVSVESSEPASTTLASIAKDFSAESFTGSHSDGGGTRNSHQQLAEGAVTTVDEEVALAQLHESEAVKHQNKSADVTPGIALRRAANLIQKPDIESLQSLKGAAEVTSSNVYHVTTNGIITANSTSLNTGPMGDLASAPRTVSLNQPDADRSLVDNLRWVVNEKLSRATINVTPANLGPITVSVDVENQNMSVSIVTNNAAAKEAIDSLLPRMREHFASEGYQQVSVDVSSQQERQANLRNQSGHFIESDSGAETESNNSESAHEENGVTAGQQRVSNSLIDTYV